MQGNQLPTPCSHPSPTVVENTTYKSSDESKIVKRERLAFALKMIERGEVVKAYRVIMPDTSVQHYSAGALAFFRE